jgi:hypothetical protein
MQRYVYVWVDGDDFDAEAFNNSLREALNENTETGTD